MFMVNPNLSLETTFSSLNPILQQFSPISLTELNGRGSLQSRFDTKYCFHINLLPQLLLHIQHEYWVLSIDEQHIMPYETLYFDTPQLECYYKHHNGKANRYKIRERRYVNTDTCFLEVKFKNNQKRTIKSRSTIAHLTPDLGELDHAFSSLHLPYGNHDLQPTLWVYYKRITLLHKTLEERVTIDLQLTYDIGQKHHEWHELVIAEIKQPKQTQQSPIISFLKNNYLYPSGVSKYCLGMVLLNPHLKNNAFKPKIQFILKNISKHHDIRQFVQRY